MINKIINIFYNEIYITSEVIHICRSNDFRLNTYIVWKLVKMGVLKNIGTWRKFKFRGEDVINYYNTTYQKQCEYLSRRPKILNKFAALYPKKRRVKK